MEKRFEDRLKIPDADGKKKDEAAAAAGKHIFAYQNQIGYNPQGLMLLIGIKYISFNSYNA